MSLATRFLMTPARRVRRLVLSNRSTGGGWLNGLSVSVRAMIIAGAGSLLLAAAVTGAIGLAQYSNVETRLRTYSANELGVLHALVVSVMEHRLTDSNDVAIGVFNELLARRNLTFPGKLWTVWSPQVTRFIAKVAPRRAPKSPQDAIDEAALRNAQPVGRFVDGGYRYSLPIVLGVTPGAEQATCHLCHQRAMGLHDGEVIAVFSSWLPTGEEFAALRWRMMKIAGAGIAGTVVVMAFAGFVATLRQRHRHELNVQHARFGVALDNMLQGVLMCDNDGTVLVVNRRFCEMFNLPAEAVRPGMSYTALTQLLVAASNIGPPELNEMRRDRARRTDQASIETSVWQMRDGRSFMVTHRPMNGGWITTYEDISERRAAEARLEYLAGHDGLTGLANRALFHDRLEQAVLQTRRGGLVALHFLDLDRFKHVNDTLGHPIGDLLLRAVAERLRHGMRETDTVGRLGGDEFAILQIPAELPADAIGFANRLTGLLEAPFDIEGHQIVVGASIGIACAPQDGQQAARLMKCADLALYRAKSDGRGVARMFHTEMDLAMQTRCTMEAELRQALRGEELELYFQPLMDVQTRRTSGYEALLRWRHPAKGLVPPDRFIPISEDTGLIVPIGEWVLRQACAIAAAWPAASKVAVNLSAVQFKSPDLVATVEAALRESGLPATRLELEITETTLLRNTDATLATLHRLRDLGIHIALDDFGTGFSSLSYLRRFPFDRIKIDQSFVRDLGIRSGSMAIVHAVTTLGKELGVAVTAEGVETWQQYHALEQAGCTEMQGYLFSPPVPAHMLADLPATISVAEDMVAASSLPAAGVTEEQPRREVVAAA